MATKYPRLLAPDTSGTVKCLLDDNAGDVVQVPNGHTKVHVTMTDTVTSTTLSPQYSMDGGTTWAGIESDLQGRTWGSGITAQTTRLNNHPMTFEVPPCGNPDTATPVDCLPVQFRLLSSVSQTTKYYYASTTR